MFDREFLQSTYHNYYENKYYQQQEHRCRDILTQWDSWRNQILDDLMTIGQYVNRRGNDNANYLIYFLNNTSSVYGRSREGNANQWMIKLNDDGQTYYTAEYDQTRENNNADPNAANQLYETKIRPLLKNVIESCDSINALIQCANSDDYKWFKCEQMLEKMMVLESVSEYCHGDLKFCLPNFYKETVIDKLYSEGFELSEDNTRVGKSYEILKQCYELLEIAPENRSAATQFEVSKMLWDLATFNSFEITEDTPNVIFYGSPGTGKTYAVKKAIHFLTGGNAERAVFIQCHPGFGYEDFMEGLKPVGFTSSGTIRVEVVNGVFKDLCIKAKNDTNNTYYFVADEINRANLSSMFGEVLSLLEPDYRDDGTRENLRKTPLARLIEAQILENKLSDADIKRIAYYYTKEDGVLFGVPKNIRFIGMMNDVDKSIDSFDLALRRRFKWIRKDCDYDVVVDQLSDVCDADEVDAYKKKCVKLNNFISQKDNGLGFGKAYEFGHAYFLKVKPSHGRITDEALKSLFEEHLKPVLAEYIRSFMDDDEIDGVLQKARNVFVG